jgi:hypothetical protein
MEERFNTHKFADDKRPRIIYEYWVTGKGEFPYDMLRYDRAWPVERVGEIEKRNMRSIMLRSYNEPTLARWASFLWSVSTQLVP